MSRRNKPRSIGGEENLARRITYEREKRGWSYEALAERMTAAGCAIHGSALFKIEKASPPRRISVDELIALQTVFGESVTDLLTPLDVLEKQRAQELLVKIDKADIDWFDATGRLLETFSEFTELAQDEPELHSYVQGHGFRSAGTGVRPPTFNIELPDIPGHDSGAFAEKLLTFYLDLFAEAEAMGLAMAAHKQNASS